MIQDLFKIGCDDGIYFGYIPLYINKILNEFYEYSTDNPSILNGYTYSNNKCNFLTNKKECKVNDIPILDSLKPKQALQFKTTFKYIYEKKVFNMKIVKYEINNNTPNYPPNEILFLLEKKLQPYVAVHCWSHATVLRSWGVNYDKNGIKEDVSNNYFCYINTYSNENKNCYDDISKLCIDYHTNDSNLISFFCLDYHENLIKDTYLLKNIIDRRNSIYMTSNPIAKNNKKTIPITPLNHKLKSSISHIPSIFGFGRTYV